MPKYKELTKVLCCLTYFLTTRRFPQSYFLKSLYGHGVFKSIFLKGMKMVQEVAMVVSTGQELDMPFQEGKEFLQMAKILI